MVAAASAAPSRASDLLAAERDLRAEGPAAPAVEPDLRAVPWHTVRRLALLGGEFVPPYRPVSNRELIAVLLRAAVASGPAAAAPASTGQLAWLLERHGLSRAGLRWDSCPCRTPQVHAKVGGRLELQDLGPGDLVPGESGLAGRGRVLIAEADLEVWSGQFWAGATARLAGPLDAGRPDLPAGLFYDDWPESTNRPQVGAARRDTAWRVRLPRGVIGCAPGSWSLTAGVFPAAVGPGLDGDGLTLTAQAASLPQLVARRTAPFAWSGFLGGLDPDHLLVRVGLASSQTIRYEDADGLHERSDRPLFSQWLVTWNHTRWWRTTVTHAALAAPRDGETLWGDLLQINFPLLSATWNEQAYGPVTDRIFTVTMEVRFRAAPWPLLPREAGRLYWEYGGEDFRPHDDVPVVPEISAPASLAGCELVDPRWDLGVEYLETRHPSVLWYSNSGFDRGYSHAGVVLGHPIGGAAESWTALVRLRPGDGGSEWELRGRTAAWEMTDVLPARARIRELGLGWRRLAGHGVWTFAAGWRREEVADDRADWLQARVERRF